MTRRTFLQASATAAAAASAPRAHGAAERRPNIVIIITDQQNIDTIAAHQRWFGDAAHGCRWVDTPNLDRLAEQGVSFALSHSANPVCSPGRSCVFTGRPAIENGVVTNNIGIDRNVPNMGQWFEQESDYRRVYCGKWHAGGMWNYPEIEGDRRIPGFETLPAGARATGDVADYTVSTAVAGFIRNHDASNPFLIVAGLMNPHDICYWTDPLGGKVLVPDRDVFTLGDALPPLPPNHAYDFEEPVPQRVTMDPIRWANYTYDYYRMVEKVDADVGRILDAIAARDDETLIVFTSDHGEGLGRHARVQKWHPYDESFRVPLLVALPGRIRAGALDAEHLVSGLDIMPTVCDYAGIPAPPQQRGRSLRPLLEGRSGVEWRDHVYGEWQVTGRMIRTPRYKYVKMYEKAPDLQMLKPQPRPDKPFLTRDGTATQFVPGKGDQLRVKPEHLLFDMVEDPWETRNLAADPRFADEMAAHEGLLRDWEARLEPGAYFVRG
jgi:choline-sulfatase